MNNNIHEKKLLNRHDKQVMLEIGFLLGEMNCWDHSEKIFLSLLATDSDLIPALLGLGNLMLVQKKYVEAELLYRKILNKNPNESIAKAYLGELLLLTDRTLDAHHLLANLVNIDSQGNPGQLAQALLLLYKKSQNSSTKEKSTTPNMD